MTADPLALGVIVGSNRRGRFADTVARWFVGEAERRSAIDYGKEQWYRKVVGYVSYGGMSGGLRAVEHLRQVFAEVHATSVRETVSFHLARSRFDEHGRPVDPEGTALAAKVMLDDLVWWADALREARRRTRG